MKIELNFKLGRPTLNHRIYDPNATMNEFNRLMNENKLFIVKNSFIESIPLDDIIGTINYYEVFHDGTIIFDVKVLERGKDILTEDKMLSTNGIGKLRKLNNLYYVENFTLQALFVTDKNG